VEQPAYTEYRRADTSIHPLSGVSRTTLVTAASLLLINLVDDGLILNALVCGVHHTSSVSRQAGPIVTPLALSAPSVSLYNNRNKHECGPGEGVRNKPTLYQSLHDNFYV